ncbi:MAG: threonine/serine dehydratase [Candidatus Latescibacterota bacterium]|nr:MAG: threonine/serine dehydratase [Candidatus Latescibacterota bacterium]
MPAVISEVDIQRAAARLAAVVHRTPIVRSRSLDAMAGAELFLKTENLQRAGAFKIRGAYNKIVQLPVAARRRGIISYSSGNHAQGVALAASLLDVPATIVVPTTIVAAKRAATEAYGARIVEAGTTSADRHQRAEELAAEHGWSLVRPYDDPAIMAGQGTVALELLGDVPFLDTLVVPVGGGGLMAGCAVLARARRPSMRIVGVEPRDADDTRRSLEAGRRVEIPPPTTIADGLRAVVPGELTFEIIRELVDEIVVVSDDEIRHAMRTLFEFTKLVVEPSGAVGVAALLAGRIASAAATGVILSGGNVALEALARLLAPPRGG